MQKRNKKFNIFLFVTIFFLIFISSVNVSLASSINISSNSLNYKVSDTIEVKILVSSDTSINAISSKIIYSKDIISLSSLSKSGSVVSFWAQEPSFSNMNGTVGLEGVILNGYTGNSGSVITLVFNAIKEGQAQIKLSEASILANDGSGTDVFKGYLSSLNLNIVASTPIVKTETPVVLTKDNVVVNKEEAPTHVIKEVTNKIVEATENAVEKIIQIEFVYDLPNYSLLITVIILLLILINFISIVVFMFFYNLKKNLMRKLTKIGFVINNKFKYLEEDVKLKIEHNKENGKISKEESDINDRIINTEKEIIREVSLIDKEL